MTGVLGVAYVVAGYWYFREVLDSAGAATPGEVVICSLLGLLFGPILLVAALCLRALPEDVFH